MASLLVVVLSWGLCIEGAVSEALSRGRLSAASADVEGAEDFDVSGSVALIALLVYHVLLGLA